MEEITRAKERNRRIPTDQGFMSLSIDDILYGYLVTQATYNPSKKELYLPYKKVLEAKRNFATQGRVDIRTVRNRIKKMIEGGYITEKENGDYIFLQNSTAWQLVEFEMLEYLVTTRNTNCIKIYCYLLSKFLWKEKQRKQDLEIDKYKFTLGELARSIGYSETSSKEGKALKIVKFILDSLQREGIINCVQFYEDKTPYLRLVNVVQKYSSLKETQECGDR